MKIPFATESEEELRKKLLAEEMRKMLDEEFESDVIEVVPEYKQKPFKKLRKTLGKKSFYNPDTEDYEFEE
jgi:hypothetical protein